VAERNARRRFAARNAGEQRAGVGQFGRVDHAQERHLGGFEGERRGVDLAEALQQQLPQAVDGRVAEAAGPFG
jgi:hypothetical protein